MYVELVDMLALLDAFRELVGDGAKLYSSWSRLKCLSTSITELEWY